MDQIAASINDYGFNDPVAVWHDESGTPVIVEGHGRVLAAAKLGLDKVPVISLDDLSDTQRREYGLIHNAITLNTGFDITALERELSALSEFDPGEYDIDPDAMHLPDPDDLSNAPGVTDNGHVTTSQRQRAAKEQLVRGVPDEVLTAVKLKILAHHGISFELRADECEHVNRLDAMKADKAVIYGGGGYIMPTAKGAELKRKLAESGANRRKPDKVYAFSERERQIVARLDAIHEANQRNAEADGNTITAEVIES